MTTDRTPRRIRRDGERVVHRALTVDLPDYGEVWSTLCHLQWPKDARVKDAGGAHCACGTCEAAWGRMSRRADVRSVVEQPGTPEELLRGGEE